MRTVFERCFDAARQGFDGLRAGPRPVLLRAFILLVFPLGLIVAIITPPGQVADEPPHILRADALLHGAVIGARRSVVGEDGRIVVDAGVRADPSIDWSCFVPNPPAMSVASFTQKSAMPWTGTLPFLAINPIAIYFPVFYVPSAVGLGLARALGAKPYAAIYAARLVSYLCFILMGSLALAWARRGQAMIFTALSMPMALSLGASCNPDGLLIACTALGVALLSRGAAKAGAACLAMTILVKPPYALLALGLLFSQTEPWVALRARRLPLARLGLMACAVLPGVLWFAYAMRNCAAPSVLPAYHPGPLWPGDPKVTFYATDATAQLRGVLAHPGRFMALFWSSLTGNTYLVRQTIGVLGWLQVVLPPQLYVLWEIGALGALAADMLGGQRCGPGALETAVLLAGIMATVFLVWLSQYLNWTNVGFAEIIGPTGRYLLPLIPLLGLALPRIGLPCERMLRRVALSLPILAVFGTLLLLPRWLAIQFYLN